MTRARFQSGQLTRVKDVWTLRYYEKHADGRRPRRAVILGTTEQFPTKRAAQIAATERMREVNEAAAVTRFGYLCDEFLLRGIKHLRGYSQQVYRSHIETMRKTFAKERLDELATPKGIARLEDWLNGRLMAATYRRKHKAVLSLMFRFAMKNGFLSIQENPVTLSMCAIFPRIRTPGASGKY